MQHTTLIVPGFHGSGPAHWQTWFEAQVPGARRVSGIDWEQPVLPHWAQAVRDGIDHASGPVWLVAHSFGCLARWIPRSPLGAPSLVVASTNDPWVRLSSAAYWA